MLENPFGLTLLDDERACPEQYRPHYIFRLLKPNKMGVGLETPLFIDNIWSVSPDQSVGSSLKPFVSKVKFVINQVRPRMLLNSK